MNAEALLKCVITVWKKETFDLVFAAPGLLATQQSGIKKSAEIAGPRPARATFTRDALLQG